MTEIVDFLVKRARKERKGCLNWPIGTPIDLGDLGRTRRGLFLTEPSSDLRSLGIAFETVRDPQPDQIDWQYAEDSALELFVKAKTDAGGVPAWSGLGAAELGFSAKFGRKGSYRVFAPELRWDRIQVTPALKAALGRARREGRIRRRDRLVVGVARASSYTVLVSISDEANIDFTARAEFRSIADAEAGFAFKRSRGAVDSHVAQTGGTLFLRLAKVRWSSELAVDAREQAALDHKEDAKQDLHLVEADPIAILDGDDDDLD